MGRNGATDSPGYFLRFAGDLMTRFNRCLLGDRFGFFAINWKRILRCFLAACRCFESIVSAPCSRFVLIRDGKRLDGSFGFVLLHGGHIDFLVFCRMRGKIAFFPNLKSFPIRVFYLGLENSCCFVLVIINNNFYFRFSHIIRYLAKTLTNILFQKSICSHKTK